MAATRRGFEWSFRAIADARQEGERAKALLARGYHRQGLEAHRLALSRMYAVVRIHREIVEAQRVAVGGQTHPELASVAEEIARLRGVFRSDEPSSDATFGRRPPSADGAGTDGSAPGTPPSLPI